MDGFRTTQVASDEEEEDEEEREGMAVTGVAVDILGFLELFCVQSPLSLCIHAAVDVLEEVEVLPPMVLLVVGGRLPGLGNDGEGAIEGVEGVEEGPVLGGGREMGR